MCDDFGSYGDGTFRTTKLELEVGEGHSVVFLRDESFNSSGKDSE